MAADHGGEVIPLRTGLDVLMVPKRTMRDRFMMTAFIVHVRDGVSLRKMKKRHPIRIGQGGSRPATVAELRGWIAEGARMFAGDPGHEYHAAAVEYLRACPAS